MVPRVVSTFFSDRIDFKGQKLAEDILHAILLIAGVVAFLVGFIQQDLLLTVKIFGTGIAVCALIVIPPWPFYNLHAVKFLPAKPKSKPSASTADASNKNPPGSSVGKSSKK